MRTRPEISIETLATSVYDNGRRGSPKLGCDCVQCFGYCLVDKDAAYRELAFLRGGAVVSDDVQEILE
jgi:hypothetical protein